MNFRYNDRRNGRNLSRWKQRALEDKPARPVLPYPEREHTKHPNCNVAWGTHACDWELGHEGAHICGIFDPDGICSEYLDGQARFMEYEDFDGEVKPTHFSAWMPFHGYAVPE